MRLAPIPLSLLPVLVCLALAAPVASAQDATLDNAKSLIATQQGKGRAAFDLLAPLEQQRAGEPAFDYLYGLAAIDAGEFTRAVFALERVLAVEPNHPQARAEIARAYFLMGENKAARTEFEAVKAAKPPAEVVASVERFLDALQARDRMRQSGVSGYLEAGIGHDSNANAASSASGFAIPNLPGFVFNGGKRSDTFRTIAGGINGRYVMSNQWSLFGGASLSRRFNNEIDQADIGSQSADAGLSYTRGDHEITAATQIQGFDVDNSRFRDAFGGVVQWRYSLSQTQQVAAYVQLTRLTYPNRPGAAAPVAGVPAQTDRNAHREVVGVAWANSFDMRFSPSVYAGAYVGEERLMSNSYPEFAHKLFGLRTGGQISLGEQWNAFASLSYEDRRYGFPASGVNLLLFPYNRLDREWNLRLGSNYTFARNWTITPALTFTENQSNVVVSAYRRTLFAATLRYEFK